MTFTHVFAQSTVSDLAAAERWYSALFGRGPDANPMEGLLEWHLTADAGVQVWSEADRAGRSTVVLRSDDLDAAAARLAESGIEHGGPQAGGGARILELSDPDGNRVVVSGE